MEESIVYNTIGTGYNTTRKADPYIVSRLYELLQPANNKTYLDIGCGTGNYTIKLYEEGLNMTGVDPSDVMLAEAKGKNSNIRWAKGTAEDIPLSTCSIDGCIATLTVHHWKDHRRGFRELARVMKPGARMVIFTFTPEQEASYWFNHFFPQMMQRGMARSLPLDTLSGYAQEAGLKLRQTEKYFVHEGLQDLFGYSGKHDPERYFDPAIINGISYFSLYADKEELENGFAALRTSIDNGTFKDIKQQYENDKGDYLFVVLEKE